MEGMMFVKPVEGRRCKDPVTCELIPGEGRNVERNAYWVKRVAKGDCVEVKETSSKAVAPKAAEVEAPKAAEVEAPKAAEVEAPPVKEEKPAESKAVLKKKTKTGGRR